MRRTRGLVAVLLLVAGVTACRSDAGPGEGGGRLGADCVATVLAGERGPGCRTVRVRFPQAGFVPQGLAVAGDGTAYVSGYAWDEPGARECQVARVDLARGKVLDWVGVFHGWVPGGGRQYCRHGGGVALSDHGLWVAGAQQLWLLDPAALSGGDPVLRVWAVDDAIRASTVTAGDEALVLGMFRERGRGRVLRYRYTDLLAPGADRLGADAAVGAVAPLRSRPVPSHVQGIAVSRGRTWLTRSTSYCGELVAPSGRRIPFLPGAEGLSFEGGRIWVASESGSRPYQRMGGRPDVPTLTRIDLRRLDRSVEADCW